jgi:hypothetical protein
MERSFAVEADNATLLHALAREFNQESVLHVYRDGTGYVAMLGGAGYPMDGQWSEVSRTEAEQAVGYSVIGGKYYTFR